MTWIYFLGEKKGGIVKIGSTAKPLNKRLGEINVEMSVRNDVYYFLGAVIGNPTMEKQIHDYFAEFQYPMGTRQEYFHAKEPVIEYINWMRERWWTTHDPVVGEKEWQAESFDHWMPRPERRVCRPPANPEKLIQDWESVKSPLANTPWSWMSIPGPQGDDFYTPVEIIEAASNAMGGIDLDAASHWRADRDFKIGNYFHIFRSAFDNEWRGKVWLNPPYGDNSPWFKRIIEFTNNGMIEQLCMLSPVWVFNTRMAIPVMKKASASILLTPTPKFWGHPSETRTGTNHPHMIIYIGDRTMEFIEAFSNFGIPIRFEWKYILANKD